MEYGRTESHSLDPSQMPKAETHGLHRARATGLSD